MRKSSFATGIAIVFLGALASAPAHADRGMTHPGRSPGGHFHQHQHRVFVFVGAPIFWAWYYTPSSGYEMPGDPASFYGPAMEGSFAPAPAAQYLYYCPESNAYYPYVGECLDGWQLVPQAPPS
jgi:hypothetical protein